jgi:hypothetical protein
LQWFYNHCNQQITASKAQGGGCSIYQKKNKLIYYEFTLTGFWAPDMDINSIPGSIFHSEKICLAGYHWRLEEKRANHC